jgi:hypothetical protein
MPGLVPGIHVLLHLMSKDVDGRVKPGHDAEERLAPQDDGNLVAVNSCSKRKSARYARFPFFAITRS